MNAAELSDQQIAYTLLALRKYEADLMNLDDEEMGDTLTDLLMIQDLIRKFEAAQQTD